MLLRLGLETRCQGIFDLVHLNIFSTNSVEKSLDEAESKRRKTISDVRTLDQELVNEYRQMDGDIQYIASLYNELINATTQGADVQPMHFNADAYRQSEIYQLQDGMALLSQNYLETKAKQEEARQIKKAPEKLKSILIKLVLMELSIRMEYRIFRPFPKAKLNWTT